MTTQRNQYGHEYDDSEPCFLATFNGMLWNRVTAKWLSASSVLARGTALNWTYANREIGIPSLHWQALHSNMDYNWGPELADTSGLASEVILNGEDWIGADGATPPNSWMGAGEPTYTLTDGVLTISDADPSLGSSMEQDITLTGGVWYVVEVGTADANEVGTKVCLDGFCLPLEAGAGKLAASFSTAGGVSALTIAVSGGHTAAIEYVRVYLESELEGVGPGAVVVPPPVPNLIKGPFATPGGNIWIYTGIDPVLIGFDVDEDPNADIWLTPQDICEAEISDATKMAIHDWLDHQGFGGLPCTTKGGAIKKAFSTTV